ncbi:hypothetical protein AB0H36_05995 [Kribbella sp. NPDC050820]|uniref:hypothetical protein n=1 Tax=Kribbella sp. NPDC050820 TaxID=3155408 RepID=UPI0033E05880
MNRQQQAREPLSNQPAGAGMPGSPGERPASDDRRVRTLVTVIVAAATIVPLYAILVAVVVRSGLFEFNGSRLTDVQFKGLWAFVGVTVTASAVTLGAWFAKLHNDRTLASTKDADIRRDNLTRESLERQKLDTAVACLGLISKDGIYASNASIAGGLATLVQLGHPIIATRALISALSDSKVDMNTATWVIGKVLTTEYTAGTDDDLAAAKEEAALLLYSCVQNLASEKVAGEFCWPDAVMAQWPKNLSRNASLNLVHSLVELLLSRSKKWWTDGGFTYTWVVYTLDEAVTHDENPEPRKLAADVGLLLLDLMPDGCRVSGIRDSRPKSDVRARMVRIGGQAENLTTTIGDKLKLWARDELPGSGVVMGPGIPVANAPSGEIDPQQPSSLN